jgi:hypothetical protein
LLHGVLLPMHCFWTKHGDPHEGRMYVGRKLSSCGIHRVSWNDVLSSICLYHVFRKDGNPKEIPDSRQRRVRFLHCAVLCLLCTDTGQQIQFPPSLISIPVHSLIFPLSSGLQPNPRRRSRRGAKLRERDGAADFQLDAQLMTPSITSQSTQDPFLVQPPPTSVPTSPVN